MFEHSCRGGLITQASHFVLKSEERTNPWKISLAPPCLKQEEGETKEGVVGNPAREDAILNHQMKFINIKKNPIFKCLKLSLT